MTCVYVSPHLDDAVFSCAAGIVARRAAGTRVVVITVFSAGDPDRNVEDIAALKSVGVEAVHLGLKDAPERLGVAPSFRGLVLDATTERALVDRVAERMMEQLRRVSPSEVWWPLGVGGHVDHRTVFEASRAWPRPRYYEERPYAFVPALLARRLNELGALGLPMPTAPQLQRQIDEGGCAAMFGADERAECVRRFVEPTVARHELGPWSVVATHHRYPGHGAAALALLRRYSHQLRWVLGALSGGDEPHGGAPGDPWVRAGLGGLHPWERAIELVPRGFASG